MYLSKDNTVAALRSMIEFSKDINAAFVKNGMNFTENMGRRNAILSQAQEKYFADEIRKKYAGTINDGRSGAPDIFIPELNKTLECKLTSPSGGVISFCTDKECFNKDKQKDFLYIVADNSFENFVVILFSDLTREDFATSKSKGRGRVKMNKKTAFQRATVLHGEYKCKSEMSIENLQKELHKKKEGTKAREQLLQRIKNWELKRGSNFSFKFSPV